MFIIAIFSSRNETLYFANMLRERGLYSMIINTPNGIGHACGISVKFYYNDFNKVKEFFSSKPFRSFLGFYAYKNNGGRIILEKLG